MASEVMRYGLSFSYSSCCCWFFDPIALILKLSSETTRVKNVQNHEALRKSQEAAAPRDARDHVCPLNGEQHPKNETLSNSIFVCSHSSLSPAPGHRTLQTMKTSAWQNQPVDCLLLTSAERTYPHVPTPLV